MPLFYRWFEKIADRFAALILGLDDDVSQYLYNISVQRYPLSQPFLTLVPQSRIEYGTK